MNTIMGRQLLAWVHGHHTEDVGRLLSTSSHPLDPRRLEDPADVIARFRSIGRELGLDFDAMVHEGSASERTRLGQIKLGGA